MHTSRAGLSQRESSAAFSQVHLQVRNSYSSTDHTSSNAAAISFFQTILLGTLNLTNCSTKIYFWSSNISMCESIYFLLLISSDFNLVNIISEILFWRYYVFDSLVIFKSENAKELIIA
jgi:hypothetical protein